jgi:hypothetical protein
VKEIKVWANETIEGNGIWKAEGVARRFKSAQYICTSWKGENVAYFKQ